MPVLDGYEFTGRSRLIPTSRRRANEIRAIETTRVRHKNEIGALGFGFGLGWLLAIPTATADA